LAGGRFLNRAVNTSYVIPACLWERRMPWASPGLLDFLQQARLRRIIRHAWKNVPFYRSAMEQRGLGPSDFRTAEDLSLLPLVSNQQFRREASSFNPERLDTGDDLLLPAGNYKRIYWSRRAALQWFARASRMRAVLNNLLGRQSGYVELHIQPREDANPVLNRYWRDNLFFRGRAGKRLRLDINEPYSKTLAAINEIRPDLVLSYGSYTELFFRHIEKNNLELKPPRIWFYGGDMMSSGAREMIEKRYGCLVYSTYGMNEMGGLGFECEQRRGFHLNTDSCHVRIIDGYGNTVPDGISGEVVISNLVNPATVILNYRTGDRGRVSPSQCACGRTLPLLEQLEGRICDTIYFSGGRDISYGILAVPAGKILRNVEAFQVVQEKRGHLCWKLVPFADTHKESITSDLLEVTRRIIPPPDEIEVEWVSTIEKTPRGKRRFVVHRGPVK